MGKEETDETLRGLGSSFPQAQESVSHSSLMRRVRYGEEIWKCYINSFLIEV